MLRALGVRGLKVLSALTRAKDSVDTALLFLCLALCVVEQLMERLKFVVYACEVDLLILILCIFHCSKILKVKHLFCFIQVFYGLVQFSADHIVVFGGESRNRCKTVLCVD